MHSNSIKAHQLNIEYSSYSNMSERILCKLSELGEARGDQLADALKTQYHKISGRFKPLREQGLIEVVRIEKVGRNNFQVFKLK